MPKPPLIENPSLRNTVVACVMLVLLIGSLGGAYVLVQVRRVHWQNVPTRDVSLGLNLHAEVPDTWQPDPSSLSRARFDHEIVLRDVDQPHRHLRVIALKLNGMSSVQFLQQCIASFAPDAPLRQPQPAQGLPSDFAGLVVDSEYPVSGNAIVELHIVLVQSRDPRVVWVLWFEDVSPNEQGWAQRFEENRRTLYRMLGSLYLDDQG